MNNPDRLRRLYDERLEYYASHPSAFVAEQRARAGFTETHRSEHAPAMVAGAEPRMLGSVQSRSMTLEIDGGLVSTGILLRPPSPSGRLAVSFPGNGRGAVDVCGIADTPEEEERHRSRNYSYGLGLASLGWVVWVPDPCGGGGMLFPDEAERFSSMKEKFSSLPEDSRERALLAEEYCNMTMRGNSTARYSSILANMGLSRLWLEAVIGLRGIDFVRAQAGEKTRVDLLGFSGGGSWVSLVCGFAGPGDPRIGRCASLCAIHDPGWFEKEGSTDFFPGRSWLNLAAGKPQPLYLQFGDEDPVTNGVPSHAISRLRAAYSDCPSDLVVHVSHGSHQVDTEPLLDFLQG